MTAKKRSSKKATRKTAARKPAAKKSTAQSKKKKTTAKKRVAKKKPASARKAGAKKAAGKGKPQTELARLKERIQKLESLLDVAKAMTLKRDLDGLLEVILADAAEVLGADRCTIWIKSRDGREIWTKAAHGLDKANVIRIPVGVGIAGAVAETGDIINIPDAYADARFNRQVDKDTGYRTKTILAVPMRHTTGEITGVVQALNKVDDSPFTDEDEELFLALGASAAAALENARLYEDIDRLFEGFVKASVTAIESRDPTTSGHSERVADFTLGIAEQVDRFDRGPFRDVRLSVADMREIRYAALLHDFGKVGVRENVLTKSNKLYEEELKLVEARFHTLGMQRENALLRNLLDRAIRGETVSDDLDALLRDCSGDTERFLEFVRKCNQPTVLDSSGFEQLSDIAKLTYLDADGAERPILNEFELGRLSIPRGSLDPSERAEIESHVTHTWRFLTQIPWTKDLSRVPEIAYAHHEKLDGKGYPRKLASEDIPIQAKMMTIADIYDALTANDRPYKRAVPHEKALDILGFEAKNAKIDVDLLNLFIEAKIHEKVLSTQ